MPPGLATQDRVFSLLLAVGCLALIVVAAWLRPAECGFGTHQQLGLEPCGVLVATGRPCPTCGMTTAVSLAAHGQFIASARAQPMGLVLALLAAVLFWPAAHSAATGSRAIALVGRVLARPRVVLLLAAMWAGSWGLMLLTWPGGT